jgi:hypothetical protein
VEVKLLGCSALIRRISVLTIISETLFIVLSVMGTSMVVPKLKGNILLLIVLNISTAQRFALLALGRAWTLFGSRKNSKPEKCL